MKQNFKDGNTESTDAIKNIRQAKDGNMLITLKSNRQNIRDIKTILSKIPNVKTRASPAGGRGVGSISLHLKGMDAITTRDEVLAAIESETGAKRETVRMGEFRPFYGSSQAVTLTLPAEPAERLIKQRELRIGYNSCSVMRRVTLVQCFRCWEHGHMASECAGAVDRSKSCRNCGAVGHLQEDCNGTKHCLLCEKGGHSAGTGGCPKTRRALKEARELTERNREADEDVRGGKDVNQNKESQNTTQQ